MNKKRTIRLIVVMLVAIAIMLVIFVKNLNNGVTGNTPSPTDSEITDVNEGEGNVIEEEEEGAVIEKVQKDSAAFIGKWTATSDQAEYLYGNVDIEIKKNGKWVANVTDEEFEGTWTQDDYGITLTSKLLDCKFYFSESGKLIMEDNRFEEEDPIITVLTKK